MMFRDMEASIFGNVLEYLGNIEAEVKEERVSQLLEIHDSAENIIASGSGGNKTLPNDQLEKIGRNDPCPCGSGKKYKNCGLLNTEEHQRLMKTK